MTATVVYKDLKDKEFLDKINLEIPFFVEYIDINTVKGKKEGWKLMNYYGTQTFPFVELELDKSENRLLPFYSERGNAIGQLINFLNNI
jgi:hypothetical protein